MSENLEHSTPKTTVSDAAHVVQGAATPEVKQPVNNGVQSVAPKGFAKNDPRHGSAIPLHTPDPAKVSAGLAGSYQPQIEASTKSHKLTDPAFNLGSFLTYYPMLRLLGYSAEITYSAMNNTAKETSKKANSTTSGMRAEKTAPTEKITPKNVYAKTKNWLATEHESGALKRNLGLAEAGIFSGMAAIYWAKERKTFLQETDLAVAAERGYDEKDINYAHLKASKNPLIQSAYDRFQLQHATRFGAGLFFAGGIPLGVIANGVLITAERTIFYRPLAFDILKKAVVDVQSNNLGESSKDELVDNLIRVQQQARRDHDKPTISREEIDGLRPVIEKISDDIIDGRFGFEGALYIMGGGVIIPENPEQSMKNFQHVHNVGISGIAHEAKWIREKSGARPNQLWEAQMRATRSEGYVAESAQPDSLKKFQNQLSGRGPAAVGSRDGSRRGGSDSRGGTGLVI